MRLTGPAVSVVVASALEPEPIAHEALRWSEFLGKPLTEGASGNREARLRQSLDRMREPR